MKQIKINPASKFNGIYDGENVFVNDTFIPLLNFEGIKILSGSYGSGKTTSEITNQLIKSMNNQYHRCYYGTYKPQMVGALRDEFTREIKRNGWEDLFDYSDKPNGSHVIRCRETENNIIGFSSGNPGMDNPTHIFVEDFNLWSIEDFGMLITRFRGRTTNLIATINECDVPKNNWVRKFIYRGLRGKTKSEKIVADFLKKINIVKHHSTYKDNFLLDQEDYRNKLIIQCGGDEKRLKILKDGLFPKN